MKVLLALSAAVLTACAPQPLGTATKEAAKATPPSSNIPTTQAAAMPGQCMGLIGSDRDQCLRRFGSSGAGSTSPTTSASPSAR
jgi:hypothetical protein